MVGVLPKDLGEYTLGEILFDKVFKFNLDRREKALSEDNNKMLTNKGLPLTYAWHSYM
jgi:hypothetical protein